MKTNEYILNKFEELGVEVQEYAEYKSANYDRLEVYLQSGFFVDIDHRKNGCQIYDVNNANKDDNCRLVWPKKDVFGTIAIQDVAVNSVSSTLKEYEFVFNYKNVVRNMRLDDMFVAVKSMLL